MGTQVRTIGLHILGWLLFFSLVISFIGYSPRGFQFPDLAAPAFLIFSGVYIFIFYFNTAVLVPKLYLKKNYLLYGFMIILLFGAVYLLMPFDRLMSLQTHRPDGPPPFRGDLPPFGEGRRPPGPRPGRRIHLDIVSIVLFVAVWSFGTALQIIRQWRNTERRALQAEREKMNAELSFLKAQINPHFLFNTLNNIYSLAIVKSDKTPDAILKVSNILRYVTDEIGQNLVPLQNEIDCINNYVELQKLRLTDKVTVEYSIEAPVDEKKVPPLLFMTFIENAFKYGVSNHERCTITVKVKAEKASVGFFCQNKIVSKRTEEERAGVGISNAKKRLDYLYPDNYSLNLDTKSDVFTVQLTIPS